MRDVNALRHQLARGALREAAQRELAHRERRGQREALHARRRACQQNRAVRLRKHAARGLLHRMERAERRYGDGVLDLRRIEFRDRPAHASARVIDDDLRCADARVGFGEERRHFAGIGGIDGQRDRAGFIDE
jgi:hypothetical protein